MEQHGADLLLMRIQNSTDTLKAGLTAFYKTKHIFITQCSSHTLWYLSKGIENLDPYKTLHADVYSSFICNCQNLEMS